MDTRNLINTMNLCITKTVIKAQRRYYENGVKYYYQDMILRQFGCIYANPSTAAYYVVSNVGLMTCVYIDPNDGFMCSLRNIWGFNILNNGMQTDATTFIDMNGLAMLCSEQFVEDLDEYMHDHILRRKALNAEIKKKFGTPLKNAMLDVFDQMKIAIKYKPKHGYDVNWKVNNELRLENIESKRLYVTLDDKILSYSVKVNRLSRYPQYPIYPFIFTFEYFKSDYRNYPYRCYRPEHPFPNITTLHFIVS